MQAAGNEARALDATAVNERLRAELAAATDAAAALDADLAAVRSQLDEQETGARRAAERFRELVLEADPLLPPALITGDTIEEIDAAVRRARDAASHVRERLQNRDRDARVPAGSPARGGPDVAGMTPEQKIRYGLAQRHGG
jgi:multidrug resistance efflux pump